MSHPVGRSALIGHSIDRKVTEKIHELVASNITNPTIIRCVEQFMENKLFGSHAEQKPHKSNHRYYTSRQDLRNHIAKAISITKYSTDDQESLKKKVSDWEKSSPSSKFFLRTRYKTSNEGDKVPFHPSRGMAKGYRPASKLSKSLSFT